MPDVQDSTNQGKQLNTPSRFRWPVADAPLQCDKTKPTCQRCTKSRRICLETSAVKQACFSIHVENCYASGKTKRPRGPRSSLTVLRPMLDLPTRALAYYLQFHLQALKDVPNLSSGLSECVSAWKVSGRTCPMVDLALSSIALAVYSRIQQHPPAATEASSSYSRLLRLAQERIAELECSTLDERNVDACLLAVSLMGRYEGAIHRPGNPNSNDSFMSLQNWSHHDGAMAILKVWNDNLSHRTATFIIKQTRRGLIKSSLIRNLSLPDWMRNGSKFGEHGLELEYDRIVVRVVNLHHATTNLSLQISKDDRLNNEARGLDNALQDWLAQIPSACSFQRHILTEPGPWPKRDFYSSVVYSYPRPGYAAAWSQCFAMRMLISSTRLRILDLSRPSILGDCNYEQQRLECVTQLTANADGLASSIPLCLERFKIDNPNSPIRQASITLNTNDEIKPYLANLAVWPLAVASGIDGIDVKQQLWFRSELARLGRITGDGVVEFMEEDHLAIL